MPEISGFLCFVAHDCESVDDLNDLRSGEGAFLPGEVEILKVIRIDSLHQSVNLHILAFFVKVMN